MSEQITEQIAYLQHLEHEAEQNHTRELYLWPRTPISNLQAEIWQRQGVSDWVLEDPKSRPGQIVRQIRYLRYNCLIPERFTLLDICCGDALIPWHVKRKYPLATCCGVDLNAGRLPTHALVQDMGVRLFRIPIQRLFRSDAPVRFDVCVMLNTYRGWESADLRKDEEWLTNAADVWFLSHSRYTILTVCQEQVTRLREKGWWVTDIGRGEDDSRMILMWPCATGELEGLWQSHR